MSTAATELFLRFACPACSNRLTVPVRKAGVSAPCPKCSEPVSAPPLDYSVAGYDEIAGSVLASRPAPEPAQAKTRVDELPSPAPLAADPVVGRADPWRFSLPWRAGWTWYLIYWGVVSLCGALLSEGHQLHGTSADTFLVLFGGLWLFFLGKRATPYLVQLCYPTITCPGCREVHDARGMWLCGCGFKSHRPRHLLAKCPGCGERPGRTDCPRCGVTIQVA